MSRDTKTKRHHSWTKHLAVGDSKKAFHFVAHHASCLNSLAEQCSPCNSQTFGKRRPMAVNLQDLSKWSMPILQPVGRDVSTNDVRPEEVNHVEEKNRPTFSADKPTALPRVPSAPRKPPSRLVADPAHYLSSCDLCSESFGCIFCTGLTSSCSASIVSIFSTSCFSITSLILSTPKTSSISFLITTRCLLVQRACTSLGGPPG